MEPTSRLTETLFWIRVGSAIEFITEMKKRRVRVFLLLFLLIALPLVSAVKQVRVIVDRAIIYIEPSRTSSRIEIVEKGTLLALYQQRKIKDAWYYVTFNSPRLGARISGFIHESSVEPVEERPAVLPKVEEKPPEEKAKILTPQEKPAVQPKAPEKPLLPPESEAEIKSEAKPEPEIPAKPTVALIPTSLPQARNILFPRRKQILNELSWKASESSRPAAEPKSPEVEKKAVPARIIEKPSLKPTEPPPAKKEKVTGISPPPKKDLPIEEKAVEPPAEKEEKKIEPAPPPPSPVRPARVKTLPTEVSARKPDFLSFGLGFGTSFGGAGASLEIRTKSGLAVHGGFGLYPTSLIYSETEWVKNRTLFSFGIKYYLPLRSNLFSPYLDFQYGGLRIEAAQIVIGIWEYAYVFHQEQKALFGPSLLAGTKIRLGRIGINGGLGLSYSLTDWDFLEKRVALSFDAGVFFHF